MTGDLFGAHTDNLGRSCAYLDWRHLARAVLAVFRENQRREAEGGVKASADTWGISSLLRQDIAGRVRERWCQGTGLPPLRFPYSEDEVARFYFRYRKRKPSELLAFEAELNGES